ncbi:MAG: hypothetical protein P8010_03775 [Desulfosarcinaceae bacterium]|jgi:hypothetical protein
MEFREKAKIRIAHWMKHTCDHVEEYARFADELERSGYKDAARNIREMATMTANCTRCLKDALGSVEEASCA